MVFREEKLCPFPELNEDYINVSEKTQCLTVFQNSVLLFHPSGPTGVISMHLA